ncbi:hypothetical protein Vdis_0163 [Vulcanisaeta distributa DSM 14429]|uniref:Uncharacterized protein n=1 Tax=Vulcanisaeta distributa (strain DSM 14429 / JCM 11212 / NBRC 100878 / IC-017) TaxID=572478 RepID=E1QSQ9_VULDI|nr:hypothetical protein Vdis_0163 [Vulcanisaeta distributa DSM 14429]
MVINVAQSLPAMASVGNIVRNWNDWVKNFFNAYIAPLNQCAEELLKQFGNINNEFVEYVRLIHDLTDKILSRTGVIADSAITPCSIERFLEYAVNSSAGHNPFMFFAWSIRTTTPIHFRAYYGDPSNYTTILSNLGYDKIQNAPQPVSLCPGCNPSEYSLHGYPDWLINGNVEYVPGYYPRLSLKFEENAWNKFISSASTLGGLLARLNEAIWSMINDATWLSSLYYYSQNNQIIPLRSSLIDYAMKVSKSLEPISAQYVNHYVCRGGDVDSKFDVFCRNVVTSVYADINTISRSLTTLLDALHNKFNSDTARDEPTYHIYLVNNNDRNCKAGRFEYGLYYVPMPWCSYMDMVIPQVMLGRLELVSINMNSLINELSKAYVSEERQRIIQFLNTYTGTYTVLLRWL